MNQAILEKKLRAIIKEKGKKRKIAVFPYGELGRNVKNALESIYGIQCDAIIDNMQDFSGERRRYGCLTLRCQEIPDNLDDSYIYLLCSENIRYYYSVRAELLKYVPQERIIDIAYDWRGDIDAVCNQQGKRILFLPVANWNYQYMLDNYSGMDAVGNNTGNLVYSLKGKETIVYDFVALLSKEFGRDEIMGDGAKKGLMPASNFIAEYAKWIALLNDSLESMDMSFTLAGVGAQAGLSETPQDVINTLNEGQKKFFRLVSERAYSIGTRGEFSADCLRLLDIKNIDVIGCPSFYAWQNKDASHRFFKPSTRKVLVTTSCENREWNNVIRDFKKDGIHLDVISQNYGDNPFGEPDKIFFDIERWENYLVKEEFSFCVGTRFHGNMLAFLNGIPTLWIVHDMRMLEMVRWMDLPYIMYDDVCKRHYMMDELAELCDITPTKKGFPTHRSRWRAFLEKNF